VKGRALFCLAFSAVLLHAQSEAAAQIQVGDLLVPEAQAGMVVNIAGGGDFTCTDEVNYTGCPSRVATGLSYPVAVCQGPNGHIYVAERNSGEVTIITDGGDFLDALPFAFGLQFPMGLHCTENQILVTENLGSEVIDITAGGNFANAQPYVDNIGQPSGLLEDSNGTLWLTSYGTGVFDVTGGGNFIAAMPYAVDDADPQSSAGAIGLAEFGGQLFVTHEFADAICDFSAGGQYETNVFATVYAPIGLYHDESTGTLFAISEDNGGGTNGDGDVYDISSGTAVLYAGGVNAFDVAQMTRVTAVCGNNNMEPGEECDDGNDINTDACTNDCRLPYCGDGVVRGGVEQCDDANQSNNDDCLNSCEFARCGDGFVRSGVEECDDADDDNTDDCINDCFFAECGDGFVQAGIEECDDGNSSDTDNCISTCRNAYCGDGFLADVGEACDDGNMEDADECRNDCTLPDCGNGIQDPLEECDDGDDDDDDECPTTCRWAFCGDGFVFAGEEECDDGNMVDSDVCLSSCITAFCGDGIVQVGEEECDDGDSDPFNQCTNTCQIAVCGDGIVQSGAESCDDGNLEPGDGCDELCQKEFEVFACSTSGQSAGSWLLLAIFGLVALRSLRRTR
jgi:cysteine-rich repeat protein